MEHVIELYKKFLKQNGNEIEINNENDFMKLMDDMEFQEFLYHYVLIAEKRLKS